MLKHIAVYMAHFDYATQEEIMCEACGRPAQDIHHVNGRSNNDISNLIALCRKHHSRAHGTLHPVSKDEFQLIHNSFLLGHRKIYLK
jgi:hypothetical protein